MTRIGEQGGDAAARALARLLRAPTPEVARALLGWRIVRKHERRRGLVVGRIVETEAYLAVDDAASHSAMGPTERNRAMFLAPGHAYVYLVYGLHHCLNVVTAPEGVGEAVLVRALEPVAGLATMRARRGPGVADRDLCRGPGRLCQAFGLTRDHDGLHLGRGGLRLLPPEPGAPIVEAVVGPRVGITKAADLPLRFRAAGSRFTT